MSNSLNRSVRSKGIANVEESVILDGRRIATFYKTAIAISLRNCSLWSINSYSIIPGFLGLSDDPLAELTRDELDGSTEFGGLKSRCA